VLDNLDMPVGFPYLPVPSISTALTNASTSVTVNGRRALRFPRPIFPPAFKLPVAALLCILPECTTSAHTDSPAVSLSSSVSVSHFISYARLCSLILSCSYQKDLPWPNGSGCTAIGGKDSPVLHIFLIFACVSFFLEDKMGYLCMFI
jgi:hypothetical protein